MNCWNGRLPSTQIYRQKDVSGLIYMDLAMSSWNNTIYCRIKREIKAVSSSKQWLSTCRPRLIRFVRSKRKWKVRFSYRKINRLWYKRMIARSLSKTLGLYQNNSTCRRGLLIFVWTKCLRRSRIWKKTTLNSSSSLKRETEEKWTT